VTGKNKIEDQAMENKMKNILTVSLLAFTVSLSALATPSFYWAAIETTGYEKAGKTGADDTGSYACYYCTVEAANNRFGGTSVSTIESYLKTGSNFSEVKALAMFDSVAFSDGEYHILDYTPDAFTSADYVAIAFYGDEAYRVYGYESEVGGSAMLTPNGQLAFNESYATGGSVGNWQAVPEPTSGLLLLLGVAGLALRRKRV